MEKEVLYFNQLLIESETPQRSVCHHLDVTWYILVPEARIITLCKLHVLLYHHTLQAMISLESCHIMKPSDTMWLKGYQCMLDNDDAL